MQNVDFNNPTSDTIFELCMGEIIIPFGNYDEFEIPVNRENHRDVLVRYDLQSYSDMLIGYQTKWFARKDSILRLKQNIQHHYGEELDYKLKVSKILKMFLSHESRINHALNVSFTDVFDKIDIDNSTLLIPMKEVFKAEFERLQLNETEYTRDEAIEAIKTGEDIEWLSEYGGDCFDGLTVYFDFITEELIENYMFVHYKPRETTLELVGSVVTDLEMSVNEGKGKVGAKIKNMDIGELAKRLSYIHRIHSFLNSDNYTSITDFPLSNETCRFIYEYFDFWGLLYDYVRFDRSEKEKRANYIKSLIRNNRDFSDRRIIDRVKGYSIIDSNLEPRIDLFKRTKEGLLSPEDFYLRMSSLQP